MKGPGPQGKNWGGGYNQNFNAGPGAMKNNYTNNRNAPYMYESMDTWLNAIGYFHLQREQMINVLKAKNFIMKLEKPRIMEFF
uniref:Uncharacterized protein n=1 Tax=Megaselia scalaris TaxID=36166 RepID=T1GDP7_MEGSC